MPRLCSISLTRLPFVATRTALIIRPRRLTCHSSRVCYACSNICEFACKIPCTLRTWLVFLIQEYHLTMASTGFESTPRWQWPETTLPTQGAFDDLPSMPGTFDKESGGIHHRHTMPTSEGEPTAGVKQEDAEHTSNPQPESNPRQRRWLPRTCRICFEVVQPTFETPSEHLPSMFQSAPGVSYVSEDPADGRLLRPCKC